MCTIVEMTENEFDKVFPVVPNHLDTNATWSDGEESGCLFGLSTEELDFVMKQPANRVWTLLDGDDGQQWLTNGCHWVNRVGYLISTRPAELHITYVCRIEPID